MSQKIVARAISIGGFVGNTIDNPKKWEFQSHWFENRMESSNSKVFYERKESNKDEKKSEKEVVVKKEVEKKSDGE